MSGGVGPCSDIGLPKEEEEEEEESLERDVMMMMRSGSSNSTSGGGGNDDVVGVSSGMSSCRGGRGGLFTFRQLNALAVMIVLSASGMVSMEEFAFVLFSLIYMHFISKVAFPPLSTAADLPPDPLFHQTNRTLSFFLFAGAVLGLFLPIAYIFEGILEGDKEGIKVTAPHVFLLASQVFVEGVASSTNRFSLPVRVFVPVFYNSRRIFSIVEWVRSEMISNSNSAVGVGEEDRGRRLYIGRALALANMAFWSFYLFCFLLPVYLPKALRVYYSNRKSA
ncbi:hypothetical protein DM860_015475 [Cuscuta australis]|uniref:DUF7733 domain-containing protein n=1 Tax=Cuscuta australis TaxID=267555 RepID=A0A328E790_9ASTE|nr:hypothetical protein DM860_015475 [Cuscuta australis]